MSDARGLQNVNPRAGTFVLLALLVGGIGVFLAGRAQGWFEETLVVRTTPVAFPADSTMGLQNGAEVQILGNTVGTVVDVKIFEETTGNDPGIRLQFTMKVRGPMVHLVRTDSKVVIQRKFGVAGSAYVQVIPGRGERAKEDTLLAAEVARDLTKVVENTLEGLNDPAGPLRQSLANVQTVTDNLVAGRGTVGKLLSDEQAAQSIQASLANVEKLTQGLADGKGMAGKLLSDPAMAEDLAASMKSINASLESLNKALAAVESNEVNAIVKDLGKTMKQLELALVEVTATTAALRQQSKDLPLLISQTHDMMRQTTRMLEAMQKSWLLRDYVQPEGGTRLSPADVTAP